MSCSLSVSEQELRRLLSARVSGFTSSCCGLSPDRSVVSHLFPNAELASQQGENDRSGGSLETKKKINGIGKGKYEYPKLDVEHGVAFRP